MKPRGKKKEKLNQLLKLSVQLALSEHEVRASTQHWRLSQETTELRLGEWEGVLNFPLKLKTEETTLTIFSSRTTEEWTSKSQHSPGFYLHQAPRPLLHASKRCSLSFPLAPLLTLPWLSCEQESLLQILKKMRRFPSDTDSSLWRVKKPFKGAFLFLCF